MGLWSRKVDYEQVREDRAGMGGAFQAEDKVHKHRALQYLSKFMTQGTRQREGQEMWKIDEL